MACCQSGGWEFEADETDANRESVTTPNNEKYCRNDFIFLTAVILEEMYLNSL